MNYSAPNGYEGKKCYVDFIMHFKSRTNKRIFNYSPKAR